MKKKVLALLLATAMIATFAGCGETTEPAGDDTTAAGDETAGGDEEITCTLTVWAPAEDQSDDNPWLKTQCEAFAAEHPNWNITFEYGVCGEGDAQSTVTQDIDAAADVFCYANDQLPAYIAAGAIAELGGSFADFVTTNFSEAYVNTVSVDGSIYGVPYEGNTWYMYYNKSVLTEEDVKSFDSMLLKGTVMFPIDQPWYNAAFYTAAGCPFFGDVNNNDLGINVGGENGAKATKAMVDLVANPNFRNGDFGAAVASLADGSVIATTGGAWNRADAEKELGENFAMCPVPTVTMDGEQVQLKSFAGSKAFGVKSTTEYPEVAMALAIYLGGESAQMAKYEARGTIPALSSLSTKLADDPLAKVFGEVYAYASYAQPLCAGMQAWWDNAGNMGTSIISGDVTADNAAEKTEAFNDVLNNN